ncbi:protein of unknown function (plasmid) [Cupriavidus taiwanensis]|uniref:Uncharacterized protein n=1 Tax=Cupriavidus taiwanensis TaxID=164546 RepID=A0A375ISU4_9BURK|nr:protein of unknown function [Cupriavidus taiwanensis]
MQRRATVLTSFLRAWNRSWNGRPSVCNTSSLWHIAVFINGVVTCECVGFKRFPSSPQVSLRIFGDRLRLYSSQTAGASTESVSLSSCTGPEPACLKTLPMLCTTCQTPMLFTEPGYAPKICYHKGSYFGNKYYFCSDHC